jgi:hypothetical protein
MTLWAHRATGRLIRRYLASTERVTLRDMPFLGLLAVILVVGCASGSGLPPETERAIESYYQAHAREEGGRCPALYIEGFTRVEVVEDSPERQVVDARYLYADRIKDRSDSDGAECIGFSERRFTLAKTDAGVDVLEMTGPRRGS